MKDIFINREREMKFLKNLKKNFFLVVTGRRRIGKTKLLLRAFPNDVYIFIWPDKSVDWIVEEVCKELAIPSFRKFTDIVEYFLDQEKTVIIDEFQNFLKVDPSIFGEFQKLVDMRKHKGKPLKLIVCGSSYSLMNKVFYSSAAPLYGRRTHELRVNGLPLPHLYKWVSRDLEGFFKFWSIFHGIPYYYEIANRFEKSKSPEDIIKSLFILENAILTEEGKAVLSVEFGEDAKTYNTILIAIAEGKTKLGEIASLFENKSNIVIKYLERLRKNFNMVIRKTPLLADPKKSKEGIYQINDNFLIFWFRFIEKNRSLLEQKRYKEVEEYFDKGFNQYLGLMWERFILEMLREGIIKFPFTRFGKQWGKIPGKPKGENQYEIDIVGLNEKTREILFCECKWQDRVNPEKILKELEEKSQWIDWEKEKRKESFGIFAKSFKNKVSEWNGKKVYCWDLRDLERELKKGKFKYR